MGTPGVDSGAQLGTPLVLFPACMYANQKRSFVGMIMDSDSASASVCYTLFALDTLLGCSIPFFLLVLRDRPQCSVSLA